MSKKIKTRDLKRAEKQERQNRRILAGIAIALTILAVLCIIAFVVLG